MVVHALVPALRRQAESSELEASLIYFKSNQATQTHRYVHKHTQSYRHTHTPTLKSKQQNEERGRDVEQFL